MLVALTGIVLLLVFIEFEVYVLSEQSYDNSSCNCSTVQSAARDTENGDAGLHRTRSKGKLGSTFLLILIPHLCSEVGSRDLIRNTWYKGVRDSEDVMLRYVMGTNGLTRTQINQLRKENETHGDIVFLEDFTESELALTNKTIALMKWATENVDFTYLMKCDDDTFLYIRNTIRELKRRSTTKRLYYGIMVYENKPNHNQPKWNDYEWDLAKTYTPFARGGCYILSHDLVSLMARYSNHLKRHSLEDVAVGSWLAGFDYERRDDDLICFNTLRQHPCRRGFHLAHLFYGKSDKQLRATFLLLQAQTLLS